MLMQMSTEHESISSVTHESPTKATFSYLQELLDERKKLQTWSCGILKNTERLLEREITTINDKILSVGGPPKEPVSLPEPDGEIVTLTEKVFVPVKENPEYNFVGRLLGPRGKTIKQLEQDLQCKIMVRGKGSIRNKEKEEENRNKPNWEHLNEELHVLLSVEDYVNRAQVKLERAKKTVEAFLRQALVIPESDDILKQMQLADLAVLNEKDRQQQQQQALLQQTLNLSAFGMTSGVPDPMSGLLRFQGTMTPNLASTGIPSSLLAAVSLPMTPVTGTRMFAQSMASNSTPLMDPTTAALLGLGGNTFLSSVAPNYGLLNPAATLLPGSTAFPSMDASILQQQMLAINQSNGASDFSAAVVAAAAAAPSPTLPSVSSSATNQLESISGVSNYGPLFTKVNGSQKQRFNPYMR